MSYYKYHDKVAAQEGKIVLPLTVMVSLAFLCVVYLIQANQLVNKNFEMRRTQAVLEEKREQNQKNLVLLMQARSLNNLEGAAKELNLVAIDRMNYLKNISGFVAFSQ